MKILLPVIGARGDVQIFLALAKALSDEGHATVVALHEKYRGLAESYGITTYSLGGGQHDGKEEMQKIMKAKNDLEAAKLGIAFFFQGVRDQTKTLQDIFPEYDLIIGYGSFGLAEADTYKKPFISVVIDPAMAQKKFTGNLFKNLGILVEKTALYFLMEKEYKRFRKEIGAPPANSSDNPQLILLPMSRHVIGKDKTWTNKNIVSGYWYLDTPEGFSPPETLLDFTHNGTKPIFVSFGSAGWSEEDSNSLLQMLSDAIRAADTRAVVVMEDSNGDNSQQDHLYLVNEIPYSWLLNHVSCVVHHCGMGTTAEVLNAGIPSVPVPHMADQFKWAKRLSSLGVASQPIPRKELTAPTLSAAIKEIAGNPEMKKRAEELGNKIREEMGLKDAVSAIESVMKKL